MFYTSQPSEQQDDYKKMLTIMGNLTYLFSENDCPYLAYRAHENIFCKFFGAANLARHDCSADAKKDGVGIGLKTWTGTNDQKVAEFNRLRSTFTDLKGLELAKKIAEYRNERIDITTSMYGINKMIYHIVKRIPGRMQLLECSFDKIDIDNISVIEGKGSENNTYFTDGKHTYHFNISKSTLYMLFDDAEEVDSFDVSPLEDPYSFLMGQVGNSLSVSSSKSPPKESVCLRLYVIDRSTKQRVVQPKSGLNIWNSAGRKRSPNEVYIPFPVEDRKRFRSFFPSKDTPFNLVFPDGSNISAKICQENDKAIMSNPNEVLGEWLLRKVFKLKEGTVVTYEMLERFDIGCVIFAKTSDLNYTIDFGDLNAYDNFYGE